MDPSLDSLIAASAPPTTPRTADLDRELAHLVAEAESGAAPGRWHVRRRLVLGAGVAAGLLGIGTAASAAGLAPAPAWAPWYSAPDVVHSQTTSTGAECDVSYRAKAISAPDVPATPAERTAAVTAGAEFLRDVDVTTIDVGDAVDRLPSSATVGDPTQAELEMFAVQFTLQERLDRELGRQGLPPTVSVSAMQQCDGGAPRAGG